MPKLALHFFIDLFVLLLIAAVGAVSIWGVVIPKPYPVLSSGSFQLAAFDTNISFYQHARSGPYYALSPFNDYLITTNNVRMPMLSVQNYQQKKFKVLSEKSALEQTLNFYTSFLYPLEVQFDLKSNQEIRYAAQSQNKTFTITRTFIPDKQTPVYAVGSTFQFASQDIVFDPISRELYAAPSSEQALNFAKIYGIILDPVQLPDPTEPQRWVVPSGKVSIINPQTGGVMTVISQPNQQMLVDPNTHLIELLEGVPDHNQQEITTTMTVEVSQSLNK